jgi:hypothetical protein
MLMLKHADVNCDLGEGANECTVPILPLAPSQSAFLKDILHRQTVNLNDILHRQTVNLKNILHTVDQQSTSGIFHIGREYNSINMYRVCGAISQASFRSPDDRRGAALLQEDVGEHVGVNHTKKVSRKGGNGNHSSQTPRGSGASLRGF